MLPRQEVQDRAIAWCHLPRPITECLACEAAETRHYLVSHLCIHLCMYRILQIALAGVLNGGDVDVCAFCKEQSGKRRWRCSSSSTFQAAGN